MRDDTLAKCMRLIETSWRGTGKFWSEAVSFTLSEMIAEWEDYNGQRAVNIWLLSADRSLDPAELQRTYRGINAGTETRPTPNPDHYREQLSGKKPLQLMREGFEAGWAREHPGQEIPREWEALFTRLQHARNTAGLDIPANLQRYVTTGEEPHRTMSAFGEEEDPYAD